MEEQTPSEVEEVALPRLLHWCTSFGLRFPRTTALLVVVECSLCYVLLNYTGLVKKLVNGLFLTGCGLGLLLVLVAGVNVSSCKLLRDLVDLVGESEFRDHVAWAVIEAHFAIFPAVVTGALPVLGYFMEVQDKTYALPAIERWFIYFIVCFTGAAGPFLSLSYVWGCVVMIRLVGALLRVCVDRVFERLQDTLMCDELSPEEVIRELDVSCKQAKRAFQKANRCITKQIFSVVIAAYMASLVMILELVVTLRDGSASNFILMCFGGMSAVASAIATMLLHTLTSVADHYEDMASDFSHNIELRFKLTDAFPGPAGVKLATSFETDYVNDLSFNFHHRPLDARVLESSILKLFLGAVVAVGLGVIMG